VIVWADRWDERATKQPAAERQLGEEEDANPPAVVQPFVSGLYAGGELSDSRPAVRLSGQGRTFGKEVPESTRGGERRRVDRLSLLCGSGREGAGKAKVSCRA